MDSTVKIQPQQLEALLKKVLAWQSGHFLLTSGLHSSEYIQCQKLLQYPSYGMLFADALVSEIGASGRNVKSVVGPALGAVHWEVLVALALDKLRQGGADSLPVRGIFAERPEGKFEIRRGIQIEPGEEILVVEDVITTGGSVKEVVELVRSLGGKPIGVGTIIDRSGGKAQFDIPFYSLFKLDIPAYQPDTCALCAEGKPVVKLGSKKN